MTRNAKLIAWLIIAMLLLNLLLFLALIIPAGFGGYLLPLFPEGIFLLGSMANIIVLCVLTAEMSRVAQAQIHNYDDLVPGRSYHFLRESTADGKPIGIFCLPDRAADTTFWCWLDSSNKPERDIFTYYRWKSNIGDIEHEFKKGTPPKPLPLRRVTE